MTNEELKAILEEIPADCEVVVLSEDEGECEIKAVQLTRIFRKDGCDEMLQLKI